MSARLNMAGGNTNANINIEIKTGDTKPGNKTPNAAKNDNTRGAESKTTTVDIDIDIKQPVQEKTRQEGGGGGGGAGGGESNLGGGADGIMDLLKRLLGIGNDNKNPAMQQMGPGPQMATGGGDQQQSVMQMITSLLSNLISSLFGGGGGADAPAPAQQAPAGEAPPPYSPGEPPPAYSPTPTGAPAQQAAPSKGEQDLTSVPTENTGRPPGDNRSAEEIINDNPALKNLGNQKDIERDNLKKQCGDWTDANPDPKSRADAAYNMSKVLNWIDSSKNREGGDRGPGDGDIQGITKSGDARHGTEAGNLKDFAEKGYGALKADHQLDQTKDSHVKLDGSNYDNFQWGCMKAAKALWFIPGLSGVLNGMSKGNNFGEVLAGGIKGGAEVAWNAIKGVAEGLGKGRINPITMLADAYKGALGGSETAPEPVKDIANIL